MNWPPLVAGAVGFEPTGVLPPLVFKTSAFVRSAIPPSYPRVGSLTKVGLVVAPPDCDSKAHGWKAGPMASPPGWLLALGHDSEDPHIPHPLAISRERGGFAPDSRRVYLGASPVGPQSERPLWIPPPKLPGDYLSRSDLNRPIRSVLKCSGGRADVV